MIMNFQRPGVVTVANPGYMSDLVKEYGESTPMSTPTDENLFHVRESPLLSVSDAKKFHPFVAKLLYLSKRTRPDILTLAAFLTTRVQSPTEDDRAKLRYGIHNRDYWFISNSGSGRTNQSNSICGRIVCYPQF